MMLRPGLQYIGATLTNQAARFVEFIRSLSSNHLIEFTNVVMRVWTSDALVTRVSVSSAVANGNFTTDLASWTDNDEAGGVSAWVTGGYMSLAGTGTAAAIRDQTVTVAAGDQNKEHALRILIFRGPVVLRVGSTSGGDEYVNETSLITGEHSIAFTPTGNFYIRFLSRVKRLVYVDSCNVEAAGVMALTSPYQAADLGNIRANTDSLSVDVMFIACVGYQQRRLERRASGRSWSLGLYQPEDGPFMTANTGTRTMQPSVLSGNGSLTSSSMFFKSGHIGALFAATSTGQSVSKAMTIVLDSTASIRVTGITTDRAFTIDLSGLTGTGNTVVLQRSFDDAAWVNVATKTWTADTVEAYTDGLDNQIVYYRLRCTVYAAGTTTAILTISTGSIRGVCRVTGLAGSTVATIEIITDFGAIVATDNWEEGLWSDYRGWPSAGSLYEGRMAWGGFDSIVLSVSDQFDGFDPETLGDSGPIIRSIGSGPMDTINWMLPLQRLILGAQLAEHSVRSNAFDEPITPSNFNRKQASSQGSQAVQAVRVDSRGFFVQRGGTRMFELAFDAETSDYGSKDVTILNPEVCRPSVVRMAVQRQPDTRIHCVLSDGTVAVLVYDRAENVTAWVKVTTTGTVEDVVVLPGASGSIEDQVYYVVNRTINAATVRYLEKWATEAECQGSYSTSATLNKQADAFVVAAGGSATLTGLTHLVGASVVVWANSKDLGTYTVSGAGEITVSESVDANGAIVGLTYSALFKSAKLGQTLSEYKNVDHVALILKNTHANGITMGPDFTTMDALPLMYEGAAVVATSTYSDYDTGSESFPGLWDIDARICLKAVAPRPCTVLAAVIEGQVSD